jgi:hypothetical protein
MISSSSSYKGLADSRKKNPIRKKPILIGDTIFVALPDSIVEELHIDEQQTFEVIPTSRGIYLQISSTQIEPSTDLIDGSKHRAGGI